MKTLLALAATVIVGYVLFSEWLDSQEVDPFWQADAHECDGTDVLAHLPHPWSTP